jgi:ParB-like nuclease domain
MPRQSLHDSTMKIELVDIDSLQAWDKNPRARDPERFEWLQMSLRKFGFVMPVYAREGDGVLYSGHQRTGAAREIGFTQVPVCWVPAAKNEKGDRNMNVLFNLCTNDHATKSDYGRKLALTLEGLAEFESLPDATNLFPCLDWFSIETMNYMDQLDMVNTNRSTIDFANTLHRLGVRIPAILDEHNQFINGAPRVIAAMAENYLSYPAVRVTQNAEALQKFLNSITMSFDLKRAFGEELRYNSFFRARNQGSQRSVLGVGFFQWVFMKEVTQGGNPFLMEHMTLLEGEYKKRFVAEHGTVMIDFGAGRLDNTNKLQAAGLTCIPFEPYICRPNSDDIATTSARVVCRRFLRWIAKRPKIDSVFCSSVFNSVPFKQDREYLMVIFQALTFHGARLYLHTLGDSGASRLFNNGDNKASRSVASIMLDTEPGLYIGEILKTAKVQKLHSKEELIALGQAYFNYVKFSPANGPSFGIKCDQPKQIDWATLVKALEFEFDLPYPNNQRMGMVDEAISAFSDFLGINLLDYREPINAALEPGQIE